MTRLSWIASATAHREESFPWTSVWSLPREMLLYELLHCESIPQATVHKLPQLEPQDQVQDSPLGTGQCGSMYKSEEESGEQPCRIRPGNWVSGNWICSALVTKRASCVLGCIKHSIIGCLREIIVPFYTAAPPRVLGAILGTSKKAPIRLCPQATNKVKGPKSKT